MKFNVYPPCYADSNWMKFILTHLDAFFNLHRDACSNSLIVPILKQIFEEAKTTPPPDHILREFSLQMIDSLLVDVEVGFCAKAALAQAIPASVSVDNSILMRNSTSKGNGDEPRNYILLNPEWFVQSERTWLECEGKDIEDENYFLGHEANLVFSFIKFIHEIFHLFTPTMLNFDFAEKSKDDKSVKQPYNSAPTKLGMKLTLGDQQEVVGDIGFVVEQFIFGNNLRVYMDSNDWDLYGCSIYFEELQITERVLQPAIVVGNKRSIDSIEPVDEHKPIRNSSRELRLRAIPPPATYKFSYFDLHDFHIIETILESIRNLMVIEPNVNNIDEFLKAAKIPLTALNVSWERKSREGNILCTRLTRKNAAMELTCLELLEQPHETEESMIMAEHYAQNENSFTLHGHYVKT